MKRSAVLLSVALIVGASGCGTADTPDVDVAGVRSDSRWSDPAAVGPGGSRLDMPGPRVYERLAGDWSCPDAGGPGGHSLHLPPTIGYPTGDERFEQFVLPNGERLGRVVDTPGGWLGLPRGC